MNQDFKISQKLRIFSQYFYFAKDLMALPLRELNLISYKELKKPFQFPFPRASFAPWTTDQEFLKIFNKIRGMTLVDIYRCWELWTSVKGVVKVPGHILEVGVWRGGTGAIMARASQMVSPDKKIFLCDTFEGVVKAGSKEDNFYVGGEHRDTSVYRVSDFFKKLSLTQAQILKGIFPEETSKAVENEKFSLCHIDVDAYESAKDVVEWVWPRLSTHGLLVFDDYGNPLCAGIQKLVDEIKTNKNCHMLHNLNGHAVLIKLNG